MSSNSAELQNFQHHFKNSHANSTNSLHYPENSNGNSQNPSHSTQNLNGNSQNCHAYDDIINTPYPFSPTIRNNKNTKKPRERIPLDVRAAEFAPFAALTGYNEAVDNISNIADDPNKLTVELFPEDSPLLDSENPHGY